MRTAVRYHRRIWRRIGVYLAPAQRHMPIQSLVRLGTLALLFTEAIELTYIRTQLRHNKFDVVEVDAVTLVTAQRIEDNVQCAAGDIYAGREADRSMVDRSVVTSSDRSVVTSSDLTSWRRRSRRGQHQAGHGAFFELLTAGRRLYEPSHMFRFGMNAESVQIRPAALGLRSDSD